MLTSIRSLVAATLVIGSAMAATPALAQDEEADSEFTLSGNASFVTDYRFRGVGLSGGDMAIQGGIDLSHSSGFYVGTWGSSIDGGPLYGEMELDIYGGWSGDLAEGVGADIGVIYYAYPSKDFGPADYYEFYGSVTPAIGPAELTLGVAYSPNQDSLGGTDNLYLYSDIGIGIPSTPLSLTGHVGYTDGYLTFTPDGNAFDWSVGASVTLLDALEVGVSYVGVEDGGLNLDGITDDTVVASVTVSF